MQEPHLEIFKRIVPETSVPYCYQLWGKYKFKFIITKPRKSKYGDYRYDPRTKSHQITINGDLNKYAFLITYLHEVAHLLTQLEYGHKAAPHGIEWKKHFSLLLEPMLTKSVFPLDILFELENYAISPKATSCSDPDLMLILQKYNTKKENEIVLNELSTGNRFIFDGRVFIKLESRRTRILCIEEKTKKKYLVSKVALVRIFTDQ